MSKFWSNSFKYIFFAIGLFLKHCLVANLTLDFIRIECQSHMAFNEIWCYSESCGFSGNNINIHRKKINGSKM